MNIKQLEEHRYKKDEVKMLESKIEKIIYEGDIVQDIVSCSSREFPFTKHSMKIAGIDMKKQEQVQELKVLLMVRKQRLREEEIEIEKYIDNVDDSIVRQIIELKYVKGLSWPIVAKKIYGYPSRQDAARKKLKRYLEKNN